jgi:S1-C subfamily serine protease
MSRTILPWLLPILLTHSGSIRGDDAPAFKDAFALEEALQEAIRRAEPSIACILVSRHEDPLQMKLADPDTVPESYGSGVVIDDQRGLILTNYHVIRGATRPRQCFVRLPGNKSSYVEVYAADPRSDLAVLRLTNRLALQAIKLGDGDNVRKGQLVLSIANPYAAGFQDGSPSASWGIISNIRRRAPDRPPISEVDNPRRTLHHYGTLLQVDARLNLGCSGGAVINLKGELIGLTSSLAALTGSETAGGFAVPMTTAFKRIIGVLKEGREVEFGFLGISFSPFTRGQGVVVGQVVPGSPAARAGLQPNDTVLAVNGIPVHENDDLFLTVGTLLAGGEARLETLRDPGNLMRVKLAKFYVPGPVIAANKPAAVHGLRVDYTSVLYQRAGAGGRGPIPPGVFVSEVLPGSAAAKARLQDVVITQVNGRPVNSPAEFYRVTAGLTGPLELGLYNSDDPAAPRQVKLD